MTTTNWTNQARSALQSSDYHSASYAAREAARSGETAEIWNLKSRASLGLDNVQEALYEARQAVALAPGDAAYHFHLGVVAESLSDDVMAANAYDKAASLDPSTPLYRAAHAGTLANLGKLQEALSILRTLHQTAPSDNDVNTHLAMVLLEVAENVAKVQGANDMMVTSREEIDQIRALAGEASAITEDRELKAHARRLIDYVAEMERPTLRLHNVFLQRGGPIRWGIVVIGLFVIGLFAFSVDAIFGTVFVLASLLILAVVFGTAWVPNWKANLRNQKVLQGRTF